MLHEAMGAAAGVAHPPQGPMFLVWIGDLPPKVLVNNERWETFPFELAYVRPCTNFFGCLGGHLAELDLPPDELLQRGRDTMGWMAFPDRDSAVSAAQWVATTPVELFPGGVPYLPRPGSVKVSWRTGWLGLGWAVG